MPRGGIEKPIGYETIWKDRNGRIRTKVKIKKGEKMVDKRIAVWRQYHPYDNLKGYCIIHLDGDTTNFDINNLVKVKKEVFLSMLNNHLYFNNPKANKAGILIAKLLYKNGELKKNIKEGKYGSSNN